VFALQRTTARHSHATTRGPRFLSLSCPCRVRVLGRVFRPSDNRRVERPNRSPVALGARAEVAAADVEKRHVTQRPSVFFLFPQQGEQTVGSGAPDFAEFFCHVATAYCARTDGVDGPSQLMQANVAGCCCRRSCAAAQHVLGARILFRHHAQVEKRSVAVVVDVTPRPEIRAGAADGPSPPTIRSSGRGGVRRQIVVSQCRRRTAVDQVVEADARLCAPLPSGRDRGDFVHVVLDIVPRRPTFTPASRQRRMPPRSAERAGTPANRS
jgi:hypothetical protein